MFNTNEFFEPGKLSTILDSQAGSSGKGCIASFLCEHADNWQFACNTFMPQAGHWVRTDDGSNYFYQTFNSCAYQDKYEKMYMGPGGAIELPAMWREIEENNIPTHKIGIHPLVSILQDRDGAFERGEIDLDGNTIKGEGTMKKGSTCHGVGVCKARKILRRPDAVLARDIPELKEFICDTEDEIMQRLNAGQAGILEIAQGYQLSYLLKSMYPYCTSRNCTVAAGLDDLMIPPIYAGNVLINLRTFPIRINSKKFIGADGRHLTWADVQNGVPHTVYEGDSGPGYDDQEELSWEELTKMSGSSVDIIECTSVTKLPRRAFTFSQKNLEQAIIHNRTGGTIFLSVNFANYVDHAIQAVRGTAASGGWFQSHRALGALTPKVAKWLQDNIAPVIAKDFGCNIVMKYIGTGPLTDDKVVLETS